MIEEHLKTQKKHIILGLQASGKFHLGHYLIFKNIIKDKKSQPDLKITLLVSDVHAKLNFKKNVDENTIFAVKFFNKLMPYANVVLNSHLIKDPLYWSYVMNFVNTISFNDIYRATPMDVKISGFSELKSVSGNYFLYTVMQCVDVFYLNCDTVYCGLDQRKIYMLAYDKYPKLGWPKFNLKLFPLITVHGTISKNVEEKMSKSKQCIPLDLNLIHAAKKELEFNNTYLSKIITEEFLKAYETPNKEQFLKELIEDLSFIESFVETS